jgi:hypothetical protein
VIANPAQPKDLQDRGYPVADEPTVETTRLGEAWRALVAEIPSLPARLDAATVDRDTVVDVIAAAAMRVLRNPEGHEEQSGAIDDWREGWKLADSTQDVYFTSAELRRLTPPAVTAGSMAYS